MVGLILKSPYYKPGSKTKKGGTRGGLANYIATREGVEVLRSGMADYINDRKGSNGMFTDEADTRGRGTSRVQPRSRVDEPPALTPE